MNQELIFKIIILIIAYVIGSLSPSTFIAKYIYGFDIRSRGSGNPGTTNAYRTMGGKVALVTLFLDVLKGSLGAYLGYRFVGADFAPFTGLMSVLGHNFPFYMGFKGGKGVATSIGVAAVIAPKILLICAVFGLIVLFVTKMVSAGSLTGFVTLVVISIYIYVTQGINSHIIVFLILSILNIYRHRANIKRIFQGTESKIGKWKYD